MPQLRLRPLLLAALFAASSGEDDRPGQLVVRASTEAVSEHPTTCCYLCDPADDVVTCAGCWGPGESCGADETTCETSCHSEWVPANASLVVASSNTSHPTVALKPILAWSATDGAVQQGRIVLNPSATHAYSVTADMVYSDTSSSSVVAKTDVRTGKVLWSTSLRDPNTPVQLTTDILASDEHVYVVVNTFVAGPTVFGLAGSDGSLLWERRVNDLPINMWAAAVKGGVAVMQTDGNVTCYSSSSGEILWSNMAGSSPSDIVATGDRLYYAANAGGVYSLHAVSAANGSIIWTVDVPVPKYPTYQRLAVHVQRGTAAQDDVTAMPPRAPPSTHYVFLSVSFMKDLGLQGHGQVYAWSRDGSPLWNPPVDVAGAVGPVVVADTQASLLLVTACAHPPAAGFPMRWWQGCYTLALNVSLDILSPSLGVQWRRTYNATANVAIVRAAPGAGVVHVAASHYVDGVWSICMPNDRDFFVECAYASVGFTPHFGSVSLAVLEVFSGELLWSSDVDLGPAPPYQPVLPGQLTTIQEMLWGDMLHSFSDGHIGRVGSPNVSVAAISARSLDAYKQTNGVRSLRWAVESYSGFVVVPSDGRLIYTTATGLRALNPWVGVNATRPSIFVSTPVLFGLVLFGLSLLGLITGTLLIDGDKCADPEPGQVMTTIEAKTSNSIADNVDSKDPLLSEQQTDTSALERYKVIRQLGRGAFSSVFLVEDSGDEFAMKQVACKGARELRRAQREVTVLLSLPPHPGILQIRESFIAKGNLCIITPFYKEGDLASFVHSHTLDVLPETLILTFAQQIADVLHHMHSQNPPIVHRDLKPENILMVDGCDRVVVGDFGLSRQLDRTYMHTHAGTMAFMAPEAFDGPYNAKVDIWSLACVMYSMCMKTVRHCKVMCVHVGRKGFFAQLKDAILSRGYTTTLADLVRQMLHENKNARLDAEEVLLRLSSDFTAWNTNTSSSHLCHEPFTERMIPSILRGSGGHPPVPPTQRSSTRSTHSSSRKRRVAGGTDRTSASQLKTATPPDTTTTPITPGKTSTPQEATSALNDTASEESSDLGIDPAYKTQDGPTQPAGPRPHMPVALPATSPGSESATDSESDIGDMYRDVPMKNIMGVDGKVAKPAASGPTPTSTATPLHIDMIPAHAVAMMRGGVGLRGTERASAKPASEGSGSGASGATPTSGTTPLHVDMIPAHALAMMRGGAGLHETEKASTKSASKEDAGDSSADEAVFVE